VGEKIMKLEREGSKEKTYKFLNERLKMDWTCIARIWIWYILDLARLYMIYIFKSRVQ
jgi:hypothetical protein